MPWVEGTAMPEGVFDCPKDSFGEKSFTFVEKRFLPLVEMTLAIVLQQTLKGVE